jgi:hypothetical protein
VLPQQADAAVLSTVTGPVLVVLGYADGRVNDVIARLRTLRNGQGHPLLWCKPDQVAYCLRPYPATLRQTS